MRRLFFLVLVLCLVMPMAPVNSVLGKIILFKKKYVRVLVGFDIAWGNSDESFTTRAFSGGGFKWKPINCSKKKIRTKHCGHIELRDVISIGQEGREWVSGRNQKVKGGRGPLAAAFGGHEPANVEVWPGADVRLAIGKIDEDKGTIRMNLVFRLCKTAFWIKVSCTPFVDFGIPNPIQPIVKEGQWIIVPLSPPKTPRQVQSQLQQEAQRYDNKQESPRSPGTVPPPVDCPEGAKSAFRRPTTGVFTSGFGYRNGRFHYGADLASSPRTAIVAANCGVISDKRFQAGGFGFTTSVKHPDGSETLYAHMIAQGRFPVGRTVRKGEIIGLVGSTGRSTGPHLHFEWHPGGYVGNSSARDPCQIIRC